MLLDQATLVNLAGIDPWGKLKQLRSGDPSQIENLASAFYQAGLDTADAVATAKKSKTYFQDGYRVNGAAVIDTATETALADDKITDDDTRHEHLRSIGKVLSAVGDDLKTATGQSQTEVDTLNSDLAKISLAWDAFMQSTGHGLPQDDRDTAKQYYINQAIAAVRTHGRIVDSHLTGYESTLASSLRSMADLGYIPPDGVDEGPGDVNLDTGTADGKTTITAAQAGHGTGLTASTTKLALINAAIKANGGHVNDTEYNYLWNYYNTTAEHSDVIDNAVKHNGALQATVGSRYGDGLLNLTQGAEQSDDGGTGAYVDDPHGVGRFGRGGYDGLPPNVLDVMNSHIGQMGPTPKEGSTDSTGGPDILRAVWQNGHWVVKNYANDTGFGDLLTYADPDVSGSDNFTQQLATTAISWKHDIDAVTKNTAAWGSLDYTGLPGENEWGQLGPHSPDPFNIGLNDGGPSGLLTAASHNHAASSQILLNSTDRHAILGLPWQGKGVENLINAGTAPDTGQPPAVPDPLHPRTSLSNEAALAVVKDAGSHYQDFAKIVSTPVKEALTTLAVTHLASFGDPTGAQATSSVGTIAVPGGTVQGLSLNNTDASSFLKLVSLSGPKYSGIVHTAALDLGSKWLAADPGSAHGGGGDHAATLIGRVRSSEYAAAIDQASSVSADDRTAYIGEIRQQQQEAQHEALQKGILDLVDTGLAVGTMGASEDIKGAVDHFSTIMGAFETTTDDYSGYTGAGQNTSEQNRLIQLGQTVQTALNQPATSAQVHTDVRSDLDYMALKASGYSDPSIAYNGSAGQESHVVDPALNKYYGSSDGESSYASDAINTMTPDPSEAPKPTVDWDTADVRRAVDGGDNTVYDAPLDQQYGLSRQLKDVTPK